MSNLLWIDLETTGLDPRTDKILELAIVATTPDLEIIAEENLLVQQVNIETTIERASPWAQAAHEKNGLWVDLLAGEGLSPWGEIGPFLVQFAEATQCFGVRANGDTYRSPLCGSTPSFDRAFLKVNWPDFHDRCLSYRHIDVSTITELVRRWYTLERPESKEPAHRALADIHYSIESLRWYRSHVFSPHSRLVRQGPNA